jgi:CubicO group peptidase (beta-lactamase class C family)
MGKKLFLLSLMVIVVVLFNPGCQSSSEIIEAPPVKNAVLVISEFTSTAISAAGSSINHTSSAKAEVELDGEPIDGSGVDYIYALKVSLRETNWAPATITAVDFSFLSGDTSFGSFSADVPTFFGTTSIAANGTLTSVTLDIISNGSNPYADEIRVKVSYSDSSGKTGTVEASVNPFHRQIRGLASRHSDIREIENQPNFQDILPVIDKWIEYQAFMTQIPGISIGIRHIDKVLLHKQYGLADLAKNEKLQPNHLFCCGSHSKMFTATAIMQLHQAQKLKLHEKVNRYLPWFKSPADPALEEITIFHLLTHSAGIITDARLPNGHSPYDLEDVKRIVQQGISTSEIGQAIKYSNFGYCILGCLIETVSGLSYEKYIVHNILQPLNMTNSAMGLTSSNKDLIASGYTTWYPDRGREKIHKWASSTLDSIYTPVGGLVSNAEDLMKFWAAHFAGNQQLLSDSVKDEMHKKQIQIENNQRGVGFEITDFPRGKTYWHIIGGTFGYHTQSGIIPQDRVAVIVLTTTTNAPVTTYSTGIINLLNVIQMRWDDFQLSSANHNVHPDYHELEGLFECPYGVYYFAQIRDKLTIFNLDSVDPASNLIILEAQGENRFISSVPLFFAKENEPIEFRPDEAGKMALYDSLGRKVRRFIV